MGSSPSCALHSRAERRSRSAASLAASGPRHSSAVAHAAADNLNRVTLELGGKSPQIVFDDADLAAAANGIVAGVFAATGQTCMAGSRVIVHEDVHDELVRLVAERANTIKLGDPNDPDTEMGPIANKPQYEKVLGYLDTARAEGARAACGGTAADELGGLFVRPTLFIHRRCARLVETLPALQHDPNRPEDVLKVDADEEGVGGDDAADALRYLVATKSREVRARKLRGL